MILKGLYVKDYCDDLRNIILYNACDMVSFLGSFVKIKKNHWRFVYGQQGKEGANYPTKEFC
jgi:hypothetical protein